MDPDDPIRKRVLKHLFTGHLEGEHGFPCATEATQAGHTDRPRIIGEQHGAYTLHVVATWNHMGRQAGSRHVGLSKGLRDHGGRRVRQVSKERLKSLRVAGYEIVVIQVLKVKGSICPGIKEERNNTLRLP